MVALLGSLTSRASLKGSCHMWHSSRTKLSSDCHLLWDSLTICGVATIRGMDLIGVVVCSWPCGLPNMRNTTVLSCTEPH